MNLSSDKIDPVKFLKLVKKFEKVSLMILESLSNVQYWDLRTSYYPTIIRTWKECEKAKTPEELEKLLKEIKEYLSEENK